MRTPSEKALHTSVARYLSVALPMTCVWNHSPNGGSRGRVFFIELKTETGRLSAAQKQCHDDLRAGGAEVALCRSLDDVETALRGWSIPLRASMRNAA